MSPLETDYSPRTIEEALDVLAARSPSAVERVLLEALHKATKPWDEAYNHNKYSELHRRLRNHI